MGVFFPSLSSFNISRTSAQVTAEIHTAGDSGNTYLLFIILDYTEKKTSYLFFVLFGFSESCILAPIFPSSDFKGGKIYEHLRCQP